MITKPLQHAAVAIVLGLTASLAAAPISHAQIEFVGEANVLTDLTMPFPPGCISLTPPQRPDREDSILFEGVFDVPTLGTDRVDGEVGVTLWRVGCHDAGFSVIMVRLDNFSSDGDVLIPQLYAEAGKVPDGRVPMHVAQLLRSPATGVVGATGEVLSRDGEAFLLAVDPIALDDRAVFTPEDYNGVVSLELYWGDYSLAAPLYAPILLVEYNPSFDLPQFERMPLHGRLSGHYRFDGLPSAGLTLSIGEQVDDSNFVFALFFTYLDGEPLWIAGNTGGQTPGFTAATVPMQRISGGQFINQPGSYTDEADVVRERIGEMTLEALDCNRIAIDFDFSEAGLGRGRLIGERLVRIAGYDCNPWH